MNILQTYYKHVTNMLQTYFKHISKTLQLISYYFQIIMMPVKDTDQDMASKNNVEFNVRELQQDDMIIELDYETDSAASNVMI